MLSILYAHARFSGDGTLLVQHVRHGSLYSCIRLRQYIDLASLQYAVAKRWADYLVQTVSSPSLFGAQYDQIVPVCSLLTLT